MTVHCEKARKQFQSELFQHKKNRLSSGITPLKRFFDGTFPNLTLHYFCSLFRLKKTLSNGGVTNVVIMTTIRIEVKKD